MRDRGGWGAMPRRAAALCAGAALCAARGDPAARNTCDNESAVCCGRTVALPPPMADAPVPTTCNVALPVHPAPHGPVPGDGNTSLAQPVGQPPSVVIGCQNGTCPEGNFFNLAARYGTCADCAALDLQVGLWCDGTNVVVCPGGWYCPTPTTRIRCPSGSYCRAGVSRPVKCKMLTACGEGSEHMSPGISAAVFTTMLVGFVLSIVIVIRWYSSRRQGRIDAHVRIRQRADELFSRALEKKCGCSVEPAMEGFTNEAKPVDIEFDALSMHLKTTGKCILDGVTGRFEPGSMVAVMGPSGGGKSTMMSALLDRAPYGHITGSVSVCGKPGGLTARGQIGFVPQDDILHCDLTVAQNLSYSAMLRLPRTMPKEQKKRIVDDALFVLGLDHVKNAKVGTPEKRGISGGQKKRVNIGVELVAYPRVLFLDEPTSGLDSAASLQVAECLSALGKLGITVVTVIHQPRCSVFRAFSHCLLLAKGGKTAYLGATDNIEAYFTGLGYRVPPGENIADWIIDIVTGATKRYLASGKADPSSPSNPDAAADDLSKKWLRRRVGDEGAWARDASSGAAPDVMDHALREMDRMSDAELRKELVGITAVDEVYEMSAGGSNLSRAINTSMIGRSAVAASAVIRESAVSDAELAAVRELIRHWRAKVVGRQTTIDLCARQESLSANYQSLVDDEADGMQDRDMIGAVWSHGGPGIGCTAGQLVWFLRRSIEQVDVNQLLFNMLLNILSTVLAGMVTPVVTEYEKLTMSYATPAMLYGILITSTMLPLFGKEKLTFAREASAGINVVMYWLARNIVNIIEVVLQAIIFSTFWKIIVAPDYGFRYGTSCMLCYAWYLSGIAHLFSVLLGDSSALLCACLVPAVLTGLYGGVNPHLSEMSAMQRALSAVAGGRWVIEFFVIGTINALPASVAGLPLVQELVLELNDYRLDNAALCRGMLVMWGTVLRLLCLARLLWIAKGCDCASVLRAATGRGSAAPRPAASPRRDVFHGDLHVAPPTPPGSSVRSHRSPLSPDNNSPRTPTRCMPRDELLQATGRVGDPGRTINTLNTSSGSGMGVLRELSVATAPPAPAPHGDGRALTTPVVERAPGAAGRPLRLGHTAKRADPSATSPPTRQRSATAAVMAAPLPVAE